MSSLYNSWSKVIFETEPGHPGPIANSTGIIEKPAGAPRAIDKLANADRTRLQGYAREYRTFINSFSDVERTRVLEENGGSESQRMGLLFMGVKPVMSIDAMGPTYARLADENPRFITANGFIAERNAVLTVIRENREYFSDFDEAIANNASREQGGFTFPKTIGEMYLKGYVAKMKEWSRVGVRDNNIKAGLLYGFPKEAVIDYTEPGEKRDYNKFGIQFVYHERNDQSVQHFDEKLENVLQLIKETNEEPIDEQEELKSVIVKAKSLKEIAEAKV